MITHTFSVSNNERMNRVLNVIRNSMPSARLKSNPYKLSDGKWLVTLSYESSESSKIDELLEQFHIEDNPPEPKKESLWKRFCKLFNI